MSRCQDCAMFVFVVTCTRTLRKYFFSSYFEWSLSWWHVQVRAFRQYSPSSRFDIRCVGGLSFVVVWNIFECFFEGGGLSFYWCISFARYAIYWYKRLEAKESFGMENTSEDGFGEEMKGNWWHGGFLFHRIKRGQSHNGLLLHVLTSVNMRKRSFFDGLRH